MDYYFNKKLNATFDEAIKLTTEALKTEGFGIITVIDMQEKLKEKLNVDFKKYTILGACNPPFAYKALQIEDKIGTMLPCNIVVQEVSENQTEVAAVNPIASMMAIQNPLLKDVAEEVTRKLQKVMENL